MPLNNSKPFNLTFILGVTFLVSLTCSTALLKQNSSIILIFELSSISSSSVDFIALADPISSFFISLVCFIATCVTVYSQNYMDSDPNKTRLSGMLGLFIISMVLFIVSPNAISMLLGWDGLGVISFCLVLFYNNHPSSGAALITALTNRIGDILIVVAVGLLLSAGHWDLISMDTNSHKWASLILLIAACTKSAQLPFSAWLPQAMAAPTPVSALVHSSTLVTAGVYLMIRICSFNQLPSQSTLQILALTASLTSVMAGLCALIEVDLKKIVALSTLSQLGTMVLAVSLGAPFLAYFHLLTHALSKSLLFLCVGSFISVNWGGQDIRNLKGQSWKAAPVSFLGACMASLSLCGVPFSSSFYSKDLILEKLWQSPESSSLALIMGAASTALTAAYSLKLIKMSMEGIPSNESNPVLRTSFNEPIQTQGPVMCLTMATLVTGYFLSKTWLVFYTPLLLSMPHKYLASTMLILGAVVLEAAEKEGCIGTQESRFHHFLHSMFFLEKTSTQSILMFATPYNYLAYESLEQGWIENLTVYAIEYPLILALKFSYSLAKTPGLNYVARCSAGVIIFLVATKGAHLYY